MRSLLPFILLLTAGCRSPEAPTPSADAPVIESTEPEWEGDVHIEGEPVLQIGVAQGGGPEMFASIGAARFLDDGKIGVSDNRSGRIVIFDSLGAHIVTLGRRGEGPDEFRDPARLFPYPGDSVAVFDFGLNRTLVFPAGRGASRVVSGLHEDRRAVVLGVLASGSLLSYQDIPRDRPRATERWDSMLVVRVDRDGTSTRPIARLPSNVRGAAPQQPPVLPPRSVVASTHDGFYWARSDRYEIARFDSVGGLRLLIRRPVEPEPIGPSQQQEYTRGTIEGARRIGGERLVQSVEPRIRDATFAETRPLFGDAFVDRDRRLWVSDVPWPSRYDPPARWSVFSDDGRWLGDVRTPPGVWLHDARADRVLGVWHDELAVAYLRTYVLLTG